MLFLTINSTEIATLPPPPFCPADNVLASLTSLPILHDRYEQANYSYHSPRDPPRVSSLCILDNHLGRSRSPFHRDRILSVRPLFLSAPINGTLR